MLYLKYFADISERLDRANGLRNELRQVLNEIGNVQFCSNYSQFWSLNGDLTATLDGQLRARQRDPDPNNAGRRLEIQQVKMDLRAKKLRKNAINDEIQCLEMEIMNEELEQKRDESKRRLEALQRLQQPQNELRSKKTSKKCH